MKKILMFVCATGLLASCTVSRSIQLTGQPIGTKKGKASASIFGGDNSIKTAAKKGNIKTIGATEVVTKVFIIPFAQTKVYGE